MLRRIKWLYGAQLVATDGEIGHVQDFYFDDQQWVVRYVVVNTGPWLPGRRVLLSPHAFGEFCLERNHLLVNLTRRQIEDSPPIESHKPLSRQYEEAFHCYYDSEPYWTGGKVWGSSRLPVAAAHRQPGERTGQDVRACEDNDPHLRSVQSLSGYDIQASDGEIGTVTDFIVYDKTWEIRQLVGETTHWFSGQEIVISAKHVASISYPDAKVFVNLTKKAIQDTPQFPVPGLAYADAQTADV